jgi:hypothetical protein
MGSEIQPVVMRNQKRDIEISRVTYLLIKKFIFSVKKYTFRSFYIELEVFFENWENYGCKKKIFK